MIFLPIQLCLWVAGHLKTLVPDSSGSDSQPATPEVEMQMTDALSNYTRFSLIAQPTTKGKAKGSKRSAPGKDAPSQTMGKTQKESKMPKILKRTISFEGPALLCADTLQENGFPFYITKAQRQFIEEWADYRSRASNSSVKSNTIVNSLDSSRSVSISVQFSKVPSSRSPALRSQLQTQDSPTTLL
jgi:hypothetical protein